MQQVVPVGGQGESQELPTIRKLPSILCKMNPLIRSSRAIVAFKNEPALATEAASRPKNKMMNRVKEFTRYADTGEISN